MGAGRGMSFELFGHPFLSYKQKSWRALVKCKDAVVNLVVGPMEAAP
jgi:hypothetical protein